MGGVTPRIFPRGSDRAAVAEVEKPRLRNVEQIDDDLVRLWYDAAR
jgi:hypothetical protein